jgi:2-desacetyl-2-hydroxyethyl bacteriochlorophyllide A dehydrogenase
LKDRLNEHASAFLDRLGYSEQQARDAKREAWWWLTARSGALRGRELFAGHAVVWTHPGRCELLPIERAGPGPEEVTIEVAASLISTGTERSMYAGTGARIQYPTAPGYSAAGTVVSAGRRAGFAVGDRVAAAVGHASVATVRAAQAYPVPPGVPLEDAAFVQLGVIARHGVNLAEITSEDSVCVLGTGVIGALALRLAVAAGCGDVTAVARSRRGEAAALAGGARAFLALGEDADLEHVRADVVIDATGDPAALEHAVAAAGGGGRVVLLGSPRGVTKDVPVASIRAKHLTVIGAHISTLSRGRPSPELAVRREACAFLDQLADGSVAVVDLVDLELDPRAAPAFYRALPNERGGTAARFVWTRLPEQERLSRRSPFRLPNLAARGVAYRHKPLAAQPRTEAATEDPLAGATGMLRVALLGCGDIGEQNAGAIAAAPNARLVACFDPVPALAADLARRYGVDAVSSAEEILARDDVDAVFLAVPHDLHAPLAIEAALAGRHVIIEKPLAQSLAAAVELCAAVRDAGVAMTVCFPHRYDRRVLEARRLISEGALGELQGTLTTFLSDKPPSYWQGGFSGRARSGWRASRARAGGGVLIMNLSHYVDLGLYLAATEVDAVSAFSASVDPDGEVEDSISVSIRYANGAVGSLFGGSAVPGTWAGQGSTELRLWGTDGHLSVEGTGDIFTLRGTTGIRPGRWQTLVSPPSAAIRTAFVSRFATAVHDGTAADVRPDDALRVQAFIEATYRSAERGAPVRPADLLAEAMARHDQLRVPRGVR